MAFSDDNITFVASKTQDTKNKQKMDSHITNKKNKYKLQKTNTKNKTVKMETKTKTKVALVALCLLASHGAMAKDYYSLLQGKDILSGWWKTANRK